jgi:hypothetical protein
MGYSSGEIMSMIKKMAKMDLAELGSDVTSQNQYIFYYMSLAQYRFASLAYVVKVSDPLAVAADGYVTFQQGGSDITDLYEQIRIMDSNGQEIQRRTSFSSPVGWWRESANTKIHIKGAGTYTLHYKAYPTKITSDSQQLEWPASSYDLLMWQTIGMIKESKNDVEGATAAYAIVDKLIPILVKANVDAQGTPGGRAPSLSEANYYRG